MINVLSDGLRYRRKRKYNELKYEVIDVKVSPEGKKIKQVDKVIKNTTNNVQPLEENKSKTIKNTKNSEFENNNKEMILKEVDIIIKSITKKEKEYNEQILPKIIKKIVNLNINSKIKVANCFTDNDFYINERFFVKSYVFELEILIADILLSSNKVFDTLYDIEPTNLINIIYFIYSQKNFFYILNSMLPYLSSSIEKYNEIISIKIKNLDNIYNEDKLEAINIFNKIIIKTNSIIKNSGKNYKTKNISNQNDEIINAFTSLNLKSLSSLDYSKDEIDSILFNNTNLPDYQIKNSSQYYEILTDSYQKIYEANLNRKKILSSRKETESQNIELFEKISSLEIYYQNTPDLIRNYLETN